jgi:hypothetical protein
MRSRAFLPEISAELTYSLVLGFTMAKKVTGMDEDMLSIADRKLS